MVSNWSLLLLMSSKKYMACLVRGNWKTDLFGSVFVTYAVQSWTPSVIIVTGLLELAIGPCETALPSAWAGLSSARAPIYTQTYPRNFTYLSISLVFNVNLHRSRFQFYKDMLAKFLIFENYLDAPESIWVCTVSKVLAGSAETVHRVWLHSGWGAPLFYGQWQRGGRHVHEHGPRSLPAGKRRPIIPSAWPSLTPWRNPQLKFSYFYIHVSLYFVSFLILYLKIFFSIVFLHAHVILF